MMPVDRPEWQRAATMVRILRQTIESDSFRYIVERRHLSDAADEIERLDQEVIRLNAEAERLRDTIEDLGGYEMKWRMMPNGMRGWCCDGYLTDAKMEAWCDAEGMVTPKEIEMEHRT